jgi:hypothetical protein
MPASLNGNLARLWQIVRQGPADAPPPDAGPVTISAPNQNRPDPGPEGRMDQANETFAGIDGQAATIGTTLSRGNEGDVSPRVGHVDSDFEPEGPLAHPQGGWVGRMLRWLKLR